jgi:uncharacterized membrane protein YkvA (DUF1232 family)
MRFANRVIFMRKRKPSANATRPTKKPARKRRAINESEGVSDEITRNAAFVQATADAESYAKNLERLRKLLMEAMEKVNYVPRGPFAETWPYLMAMIRLIRAYHQGEYRDISSENLLIILAAIIYFVSPNDAIPDSVPILGQIDDAIVIRRAMKPVGADLDTFMAWETVKI